MNKRNYEIDFLRFLFAILVVASHVNALFGWRHFWGGAIGVEFFFVVSGVFFARSLRPKPGRVDGLDTGSVGKDSMKFIFHKIGGFYPYFLFSFLLAFIVKHLVPGTTVAQTAIDGVQSVWELLLLQVAGFPGYWPVGTVWFLSALVLSEWILYPLARKNYDLFLHWFAPLAAILIIGIVSLTCDNIHGTVQLLFGFAPRGILRGISEICLGCLAYEAALWLKGLRLSRLARILLTIVELGGYAGIVAFTWYHRISNYDYILLLVIALCVTITMSEQNLIGGLFQGRLPLGKLSLTLYLNHFYWIVCINAWFPQMAMEHKMLLFAACAMASSVLCLLTVDAFRKRRPFQKLKNCLLEPEERA